MKLELNVNKFANEDVIATSTFYEMDYSHLYQMNSNYGKVYLVDLGGKPPIDEVNHGDTVKAKNGITYEIIDSKGGENVWNLKINKAQYNVKDFLGTWSSSDNKHWVVK